MGLEVKLGDIVLDGLSGGKTEVIIGELTEGGDIGNIDEPTGVEDVGGAILEGEVMDENAGVNDGEVTLGRITDGEISVDGIELVCGT